MTLGSRIEERRKALGISQSELARRVGVRQSTINGLIKGDARSSRSIVRIALELKTTPAYLTALIDDPDVDAPPPAPPEPQFVMMAVALPPVRALTRMFEALLSGIDPDASQAERALLLAERLATGLSQLRDLRPESARLRRRERADGDAAPAMPDHEPTS